MTTNPLEKPRGESTPAPESLRPPQSPPALSIAPEPPGAQGATRAPQPDLPWRYVRPHGWVLPDDDLGMSTTEYAIGTIAAAAFGAVLYTVVTGDSIVGALTAIIARALGTEVG